MADITFKGNPIHSISELPAVGSDAPDFEVTGDDLGEVKLSDFKGQKLVINIFPSLDTGVCATSVRTFTNTLPVLTRDENIVIVSFNVQYRVSDPELFLFGTQNAIRVLEQVSQSAVREQIGRADLDTALNARGPLSAAAATSLQASLETYRTGTVFTELNLQDARPPRRSSRPSTGSAPSG